MSKSQIPIPPGEGERRAQRGYVRQYQSAAAAIYAALVRDDLIWVGLADRDAGAADDVVLGLPGRVVGHQFKASKFSQPFRLKTLLIGTDGLLPPLAFAWQRLKNSFPDEAVEIRLVTNDYPSASDSLIQEATDGHSAAFLREVDLNPNRTLADWRSSRWQPFIDNLAKSSGLGDQEFEEFFVGLRVLFGPAADFVQTHRLTPDGERLAGEIANLLPRLVANGYDKDRWTRSELLSELGWRDSFALRRSHQFPVGAYVQRNVATEQALRSAIQNLDNGYVALVGAPGAGKSTLLQTSVAAEPGLLTVRYLAFVPGEGQGLGRGEAEDFLDDLNTQLKRSGLAGLRFRDTTLQERREQFEHLLTLAGERFQKDDVRTLIVVDGLDHIPREERPGRSLLAELPLPASLPAGVLIVLGTQRLDLTDLKPAVQQQASLPERHVVVASLSREAVYRMTEAFGLDSDVPREQIFELSLGHPLVTRYLLEALRDADATRRESLLAGEFTFAGDIEVVYESAWFAIKDDDAAREVMGYIAHAEGPIQPRLLAQAVSEQAVERALASTRHLLSLGSKGWTVFHNSFRLFILSKPRLRFGKPDPDYSPGVYRGLAELARVAETDSPQRWLELRYFARAQQHAKVLELATPARFREQLADARPAAEIQADIRLAFGAARDTGDATLVFRLLLASDEIGRRATALEYAPGLVGAMLAMGDIDGAQAFAVANADGEYKVVDALLQAGDVDRARALFDRIEPLGQLLGRRSSDLDCQEDELRQWAKRVFHFREADQIEKAIQRLSTQDTSIGWTGDNVASLGESLRLDVARAAMEARPVSDPFLVANQLKVADRYLPYLFIEAGLSAYDAGDNDRARDLLSQAVSHSAFLTVENGWLRQVALVAAQLGDAAMARSIFAALRPPTIAMMDGETGDDALVGIARAVMEYAELATQLGEPAAEVAPSKRHVLRPLQHHASTVGVILGRAGIGGSVSQGEVERAARNALAYLERAQAGGAEEFYALRQIAAAAPVLGRALVRAAALCGKAEFEAVVAEFDRSFERPGGKRINLRREFVIEVYQWDGDVEAACQRLEPLVPELREGTPEGQVEELAALATTFARVGNLARARQLLRQLHSESLGYSLGKH